MTHLDLDKLVERLVKLPKECEWVEFKLNWKNNEEIGEYISALSNGASTQNEPYGYLLFGIKDEIHNVVGTSFRAKMHKVGKEEFEHWLFQRLSPRIEFEIFEHIYQDKLLSIFRISAAQNQPVYFCNQHYIRIGSIKRSLKDFPEKERKIWGKNSKHLFEKAIALESIVEDDVVELLDTQSYFELMKLPYPKGIEGVIQKFSSDKLILSDSKGMHISNLGALLFAKNLNQFDTVKRKAVRVIQYSGKNKLKTLKDQLGEKGYAAGFEGLISFINTLLPSNEEIGSAFRNTVVMYPAIAIRELAANAIIHQDLNETGTSPLVEIYEDRIEISNPGLPLISSDRFIDEYQSRNEEMASLLRRMRICEEKGSGIDKVIFNIELFQLPALDIQLQEKHTKVVLYAHQSFANMDKKDRIRACYQHACLKYVTNDKMTNQSLRGRFKIADENAAMVSRIIKETVQAGLIKEDNPDNTSRKYVRYIPIWA
ncbi:MAG TPA: ATP-binding protein [Puia sp.]|nr:ATP-binding protein [Puia sp.]